MQRLQCRHALTNASRVFRVSYYSKQRMLGLRIVHQDIKLAMGYSINAML